MPMRFTPLLLIIFALSCTKHESGQPPPTARESAPEVAPATTPLSLQLTSADAAAVIERSWEFAHAAFGLSPAPEGSTRQFVEVTHIRPVAGGFAPTFNVDFKWKWIPGDPRSSSDQPIYASIPQQATAEVIYAGERWRVSSIR